MPGRTLAINQTIWLSNAHRADTKVFSRALIAKSASVKTVVCFPHLGGVVELGTTGLVQEDPNLIRHIASFLESHVTVSKIPNHVFNASANNNDLTRERLDHANMPEEGLDDLVDDPYVEICSPNSSDDIADDELTEESNLVEGVDGEASQIQSWPVMDDAVGNCVKNSVNPSDRISKTHEERKMIIPLSDGKKETKSYMHDNQECNQQKTSDVQGNDSHYHRVLSNLLKSSHQLLLGPYIRNESRGSSFVCWRKDGSPGAQVSQRGTPQKLLKKVLFEVARMHDSCRIESGKQNANSKREVDEIDSNHVLSERKRREKINERFVILGSLVPSGGKAHKVSILDHTIEYLRGLERKVEELESYKEAMEQASATRSKSSDSIERTSDNYGKDNPKKPATNKRKACDKDRIGAESSKARLRDSSTDSLSICVSDKDVLIKIRCSWKEHVLLEVMETLSKLRLETSTVQSSTTRGTLSITVNAKCKGVKSPSAEVIKQALQKVTRKC